MLLFFVRHGQPIYDPDSLTPLGRRQAESVARRLSQFGIDRVFASTSRRAIETSRPTCDILRLEPTLLDWINESHAWEELSVETGHGRHWCYADPSFLRLFADPSVRALGERWHEHPAFAGHPSFGAAMRRMRAAVDEWTASLGLRHNPQSCLYEIERPSDERIALFAHEGAGILFLSTLLDIPYPVFAPHFTMQHTGMTVIEFQDLGGFTAPRVLQLSGDAHLYRDGLPLRYQDRLRF